MLWQEGKTRFSVFNPDRLHEPHTWDMHNGRMLINAGLISWMFLASNVYFTCPGTCKHSCLATCLLTHIYPPTPMPHGRLQSRLLSIRHHHTSVSLKFRLDGWSFSVIIEGFKFRRQILALSLAYFFHLPRVRNYLAVERLDTSIRSRLPCSTSARIMVMVIWSKGLNWERSQPINGNTSPLEAAILRKPAVFL